MVITVICLLIEKKLISLRLISEKFNNIESVEIFLKGNVYNFSINYDAKKE